MPDREAIVIVKPGREQPLRDGRPWLYKGAVQRLRGYREPGQPCRFVSRGGEQLGRGYCNAGSLILGRVVDREHPFSAGLVRLRLEQAVLRRARWELGDGGVLGGTSGAATDAYRLVNGEGDGLPGLVVDRYGPGVVLQILTAGMERIRKQVLDALRELLAPAFVVERSDTAARAAEGLAPRVEVAAGRVPDPLTIREDGLRHEVDLTGGHKTGLYLDQRENRRLVRRLAGGASLLNGFCYTGGFSVSALAGGARQAVGVDTSRRALARARRNLELNDLAAHAGDLVREDMFRFLRPGRELYDLVVLDPPKFARRREELDRALQGYRELNRLALAVLAPGGLLLTFSCSGLVGPGPFQQAVQDAAAAAGRRLDVLQRLQAGPDHPWPLGQPGGDYLKGLLVQAD